MPALQGHAVPCTASPSGPGLTPGAQAGPAGPHRHAAPRPAALPGSSVSATGPTAQGPGAVAAQGVTGLSRGEER